MLTDYDMGRIWYTRFYPAIKPLKTHHITSFKMVWQISDGWSYSEEVASLEVILVEGIFMKENANEQHACIIRRENATLKSDLHHARKPLKTPA